MNRPFVAVSTMFAFLPNSSETGHSETGHIYRSCSGPQMGCIMH